MFFPSKDDATLTIVFQRVQNELGEKSIIMIGYMNCFCIYNHDRFFRSINFYLYKHIEIISVFGFEKGDEGES